VKKVSIRYDFHEITIVLADPDAAGLRTGYRNYLGGDTISSHYEVKDVTSGEELDLDFSKFCSIHTNPFKEE
jgi:hypothetical protein